MSSDEIPVQVCQAASEGRHDAILAWVQSHASSPSPATVSTASLAIISASTFGHLDCLRTLLQVGDPSHNACEAIEEALNHHHHACLELLLDYPHPSAPLERQVRNLIGPSLLPDLLRVVHHPRVRVEHPHLGHLALRFAARQDEPEVIQALLLHVDPAEDGSLALWHAAAIGNLACFKQLLPRSNPVDAFDHALNLLDHAGVNALAEYVDPERWQKAVETMDLAWIPEVLARWEAWECRQVMEESLSELPRQAPPRPRV